MNLSQEIKDQILINLNDFNINKIILFGSYAYGNPTNQSDIDLLVVTNDDYIPQTFNEYINFKVNITRKFDVIREKYPMDILVHTKAMHIKFIELGSWFSKEILTKGYLLYEGINT